MAQDLNNKVVVITGGAVGIGLEIADRFLQNGAKVAVLLDVNVVQGAAAVKTLTGKHGNGKAAFYKCDVTSDLESIFNTVVGAYKNVDVLVNNAGILDDTKDKLTIDINVTALIQWSMKYWEHMRKDKGGNGGTIINLASIYGFRVDQYLPIYQASKFAVLGFTKSLGHVYNYNRTDVKVVAICPGFTETKLTAAPKTWPDQQLQEDFTKFVAQQAWQKVDSVGKAAVEIYGKPSGTAWLIEGAKPIIEV